MAENSGYKVRGYEGFPGVARELASESVPAWQPPLRAATGSPNVILMLMDDMGFSDIGPFGSEIDTPTLNVIAEEGYRLANYQTPAMCAPARAALMTGLNPHRAGFSYVPHMDPGYPNARFELPADVPTLAENFRANGYATFMTGKWHLTPEAQQNDAGNKSSWPLQRGFDRYFGCLDGFTSLFHPHRLVRDNGTVDIDEFPEDYFLTDAMTEEAIGWIKALRAGDATKPFFLYSAQVAVHAPLQAKAQDMEKYRGRYESGWDHIRDQRFHRQMALGLFPDGTQCAPRNAEPDSEVVPWDSLTEDERLRFARYMEVYAGTVDNVDQNLGRLLDYLRAIGEYENTIIVFTSDNGGSGEGGAGGTRSYLSHFGAAATGSEDWDNDVSRDLDLLGGPRAFIHYPRGWAYASNTPFRLYKTHQFMGGVRVPMLLSWPAGLPRKDGDNGVRHQYAYATDVGRTLLQLAGCEELNQRQGLPAKEPDGVSFAAFLRDQHRPTEHSEQYMELVARRAYLDGDWKLLTARRGGPKWADDRWQLYNVADDPTELRDIAAQHPDRVADMAEKWRKAAWYNTVFPLNNDGSMNRTRPSTELMFSEPLTLYPGTPVLERFRSARLIQMRSFSVEASFEQSRGGKGVLVAHGDQGGGYVLYVEEGQLCFAYNEYGRMHRIEVSLGDGEHVARLNFDALPGFHWRTSVSVDNGEPAILDNLQQFMGMAPFTGISVGRDAGGPVDWDVYERHRSFPYTGRLRWVHYEPGEVIPENNAEYVEVEKSLALACD